MKYKEPVRGNVFEFKLVPINDFVGGQFQRNLSTGLVNKLVMSIDRGFVIPVVAVAKDNGEYEIIDGQHRIENLRKRSDDCMVPTIVVPEEFKFRPLLLNIEKGDNIKDKCDKIYNLYIWHAQNKPEIEEKELLPAAGFEPSLFTLAFSYNEFTLASPSLVETVTKKFDSVIDDTVESAIIERRNRARKVSDLANLVDEIALENGFKDFNLKRAMISKSSMVLWGRARLLDIDFYDGINSLMDQIEQTDWSGYGQ